MTINKRKIIGERVKNARLDLNISQEILANKLNQTQCNISKIESGKISIKAEEISTFSKVLKKDVIYFLSDI